MAIAPSTPEYPKVEVVVDRLEQHQRQHHTSSTLAPHLAPHRQCPSLDLVDLGRTVRTWDIMECGVECGVRESVTLRLSRSNACPHSACMHTAHSMRASVHWPAYAGPYYVHLKHPDPTLETILKGSKRTEDKCRRATVWPVPPGLELVPSGLELVPSGLDSTLALAVGASGPHTRPMRGPCEGP